MDWIAAILAVVGNATIVNNPQVGAGCYIISNLLLIVYFSKRKTWSLLLLQMVFLSININIVLG